MKKAKSSSNVVVDRKIEDNMKEYNNFLAKQKLEKKKKEEK